TDLLLGERRVAAVARRALRDGVIELARTEAPRGRGGVHRARPLARLLGVTARALPCAQRCLCRCERGRGGALRGNRCTEHACLVGIAARPRADLDACALVGLDRFAIEHAAITWCGGACVEREDVI